MVGGYYIEPRLLVATAPIWCALNYVEIINGYKESSKVSAGYFLPQGEVGEFYSPATRRDCIPLQNSYNIFNDFC
jgi:hypothetical protein